MQDMKQRGENGLSAGTFYFIFNKKEPKSPGNKSKIIPMGLMKLKSLLLQMKQRKFEETIYNRMKNYLHIWEQKTGSIVNSTNSRYSTHSQSQQTRISSSCVKLSSSVLSFIPLTPCPIRELPSVCAGDL